MRLYVDEMPKSPSNCQYSKWEPNPPFIEEPGVYKCNMVSGNNLPYCDLDAANQKCRHLCQCPMNFDDGK